MAPSRAALTHKDGHKPLSRTRMLSRQSWPVARTMVTRAKWEVPPAALRNVCSPVRFMNALECPLERQGLLGTSVLLHATDPLEDLGQQFML